MIFRKFVLSTLALGLSSLLVACDTDPATTPDRAAHAGGAGAKGGASSGSSGRGGASASGGALPGGAPNNSDGGTAGEDGENSAGGAAGGQDSAGAGGSAPELCEAQPYPSGRHSIELEVDGTKRRFLLYVPKDYKGSERVPLLFNLHPSGGSPEGHMDDTKMDAAADKHGFVVAALAGVKGLWNVARDPGRPDDVALAERVLEFAEEKLCVDFKRVYSTGFSGGARTSSRFACAMPERIAAIAPVAGIRNDPPCDAKGIDVLTLHGTADGVNFYNGCDPKNTGCSRNGEWAESVENAIADWVKANGCNTTPKVEDLGKGVSRLSYADCSTKSVVVFYRVTNGTHTWHLLENSTDVVVDFLLKH